jgi:hypothetical protein
MCAAVAATALCATACAPERPTSATAESTVTAFYAAISRSDGAAACDRLAPVVVESLESDADEPCGDAVLDGDVGDTLAARTSAGASSTSVAGRQAQVLSTSDVVFLTISRTSWLITAAGCDPRPHRPYDCAIEGS